MDQDKVNEMAIAIVAANAHTPEEIVAALNEYWDGKMAVVWERSDVFGKAWMRGVLLTHEQADEILDDMRRHHDAELGITWTTIECALDEVEPLDIKSLDLAKLADYPGEFRVWWTDNCKSCHWAGSGGGGNFGMPTVVCGCPASVVDPNGDCPEYEMANDADECHFKAFDTDEGRNLAHALAFAVEKAAEVDGEVQVCVVVDGGNEYPVAYYEIADGKLVIENASDRNREICPHGFAESCPENCN